MSELIDFSLPGGWPDARGAWHRDGCLRPLTGQDEEWLHAQPASTRVPQVVTEVLHRCVRRIGPHRATRDQVRALTVGDRDYLVLAVLRATFGETLALILTCPACAARMDLDLRLEDLPITRQVLQESYPVDVEQPVALAIEIRLPTGADQEALSSGDPASVETLTHRLIRRCIVAAATLDGAAVDPADLTGDACDAVAAAIEGLAPRVELELGAACTECGHAFDVWIDPSSLLIEEISRCRGVFDRELHLLARHYHWSPRELLGLSRPRRQRFLKILVQALEAQG